MPASTALLTDHYELTMLRAALQDGTAQRRCVFELFSRSLHGRRYGVVCGTGRLLDLLADFRFGEAELEHLERTGVLDDATCAQLSGWRFSGDVDGYAEGEVFLPGSPVLTVTGTFADAVVLETLALSVFNSDTAVATAAARMVRAAGDRPCAEFGGRRTHEQAAVSAARAAYVAGFASTSNLEAGRRFGVPTSGTSAHSFTLLHDDEQQAFRAQVAALGPGTTLLVDTFDTLDGVRRALQEVGPGLGAVRIDSGDLAAVAQEVRALLDEHGAHDTRIVVTSDLDEHAIAALAAAPVDGYGVGTALVTGSGVPTVGFVYKLVAREREPGAGLEAVAKTSTGKAAVGGRKTAYRRSGDDGRDVEEVVVTEAGTDASGGPLPTPDVEPARDPSLRPLQVPLVRDGERVDGGSLQDARERCRRALDALPVRAFRLSPGDPCLPLRTVTAERGRRVDRWA